MLGVFFHCYSFFFFSPIAFSQYDHFSVSSNDPTDVQGSGFHPSWGNLYDDSQGECGVPLARRFHMPDTPGARSPFWYSHDYQTTHFIYVSTEHNCSRGSEQYEWLERDLADVNRAKTPWVILIGHRAMYNSEPYPDDYNTSLGLQAEFEELLQPVDLCLWGHYHAYLRTCPVFKQECVGFGKGPVHITIGSAGADQDMVNDDDLYKTPWKEYFTHNYGYGRIYVENNTALRWEFVENQSYSVKDSVWIVKP